MARTGWAHMNGLAAAATWWCCCTSSPQHSAPPSLRPPSACCLLLLLLLPQQPFLAVRRGTERAAAGWHQGPLGVRAGAALGGGRLVAGLCSAGDPPQQGVAEEAGQAGREDSEATPSQPPGKKSFHQS